jgi:hypothetical protein
MCNEKSLQIPKGQLEDVNLRRTENVMAKRQGLKEITKEVTLLLLPLVV